MIINHNPMPAADVTQEEAFTAAIAFNISIVVLAQRLQAVHHESTFMWNHYLKIASQETSEEKANEASSSASVKNWASKFELKFQPKAAENNCDTWLECTNEQCIEISKHAAMICTFESNHECGLVQEAKEGGQNSALSVAVTITKMWKSIKRLSPEDQHKHFAMYYDALCAVKDLYGIEAINSAMHADIKASKQAFANQHMNAEDVIEEIRLKLFPEGHAAVLAAKSASASNGMAF